MVGEYGTISVMPVVGLVYIREVWDTGIEGFGYLKIYGCYSNLRTKDNLPGKFV